MGISPILFHATYVSQAAQILREDCFRLSTSLGTRSDQRHPEVFYFSCSRIKTGGYARERQGGAVTFRLDGVALGHNYSGSPVDYWGPEYRKAADYHGKLKMDENEDRIFTDKPYIRPAHRYIEEVHVLVPTEGDFNSEQWKRDVRTILLACKTRGIPAFLYQDQRQFELQQIGRAIPLSQINLSVETQPRHYSRSRVKSFDGWLELLLLPVKPYEGLSKAGQHCLQYIGYPDRINVLMADIHSAKNRDETIRFVQALLKAGFRTLPEFIEAMRQKWAE